MIPAVVQEQRELNVQVAQFEGLVYSTARLIIEQGVELEFEDVRQLLRIKVLYAVRRYSKDRSGLSLQRFVFGAVRNVRKDIELRPRRFLRSIEDLRDDAHHRGSSAPADTGERAERFDAQYLSIDAERVYFEIEDEAPCWMSRLTKCERAIVKLRSDGLRLDEIDHALGLEPGLAQTAMRSVREKLADWRPSAPEPRSAPMRPLPAAGPRTDPTRLARVA